MFQQINNILKEEIKIKTLAGRSYITVLTENGEIKIKNSRKNVYTIDEKLFSVVLLRYNELPDEQKTKTSEYSLPKWEECPEMIIAPYVAALINYWHRINQKKIDYTFSTNINKCSGNCLTL